MCSILSHEKAVIWAVLSKPEHWTVVRAQLRSDHFGYAAYAKAYRVCEALYGQDHTVTADAFYGAARGLGLGFSAPERKGLARMLRLPAPARAQIHLVKLAQAVRDRASGRPVVLAQFAV